MELITIEDHSEIYQNEEIANLLSQTMYSPTSGKVRSVAEATYSKFKNRFYIAMENQKIIGILGTSKVNHGVCTILHLAVDKELDKDAVGKAMIDVLKEERSDIIELAVSCDRDSLSFYKTSGFKVLKAPSNDIDIEMYDCRCVINRPSKSKSFGF
jgi:N-acetylglutamate synthase-like GNAT family acetyltransferase